MMADRASRLNLSRQSLRCLLLASAALAGLGAPLVLGLGAAGAQDGPNPSLVLSFGSRLSVDDNRGLDPVSAGTTSSFDTRLGLVYLSETTTSSLRLAAGTVLRFSEGPDSTANGFDDPRLALNYTRSGADSLLSFNVSQVESQVAFFDPLTLIGDGEGEAPPPPVDPGDLVTGGTGSRTDRSLALRFETGLGRPLGLSVQASRRERDFSGTTDPDQFDTTTDNLTLGARFRISDRTEANLTLSRNDFSAEDLELTERQTDRISLGIDHALRPDLSLRFSLGQSRVRVEETIGMVRGSRTTTGLNGSLALTRDLVNGMIGLVLGRDISIDGARTDLTLNRSLDLPSGTLALSFGASQGEGDDATWIGTLNYTQDLPRGQISATLDRRVGLSDADAATATTRARLGWSQDLTVRGGLDLSVDYLDVDSDTAGDDRSRARLSMAYTWDLTEDWQLAGGYTRTQSRTESSGSAASNMLFLSLDRDFTFAP